MLVAITGATGVQLAIRLLETLKEKNLKTELVISKNAEKIIAIETKYQISDIYQLATRNFDVDDLQAPPASGSYKLDSMIIIPCSMKSLSAIANGYANNLITRAADVMIKEKRNLILVVRESPLSAIHLENMLKLAKLGVIIFPPVPSYYFKPKSVEELIEFTVGRILDYIGIESDIKRWGNPLE
ncbi:MAG: UbiX family flavin prenyltransferase [Candidatus Lokiarchaeota archaeon]|nr:UbiX family flavin prenyltransferase [Candidatus Lokiarchaeota archaeon]